MTQKVATGGTPSKAPIGYLTWATEESGLLLACSVKTIMFPGAVAALTLGQAPGRPGCRSWAEEPLTVIAAAQQEGEAVQAVAQLGAPIPGVRPDRPVFSPT